jgi:hypothetical protein
MNRLRSRAALGAAILIMGFTAAGITITPASHDFGKWSVNGWVDFDFQVRIPPGAGPRDTVTQSVTGPDVADFQLNTNSCETFWRTGSCLSTIIFMPKSLGPKSARLVVSDSRGNSATALLTGTAVAPVCTNRVVFCNYGHFYSGTFNWTSNLTGPGSSASETVSVTVVDGVATCNGSATSTSPPMNNYPGRSTKGAVTGTGLFAVEFVRDTVVNPTNKANNTSRLVYRVTVACPSPSWPATVDGPATPSRPAELGDFFQQSYNQPATAVGMDLVGSISYPAPEVDALNGVNGAVQVNWSLKHK